MSKLIYETKEVIRWNKITLLLLIKMHVRKFEAIMSHKHEARMKNKLLCMALLIRTCFLSNSHASSGSSLFTWW
jgi:hypothetical protein